MYLQDPRQVADTCNKNEQQKKQHVSTRPETGRRYM